MSKNDRNQKFSRTAAELFVTLIMTVFVTNALTNLLSNMLNLPALQESLLDSILVILLAYPALYLLIFRPLSREISRCKKVEKLKDEFIGTVSHELRTPLSITKEGICLVVDNIAGPTNEQQAKILTTAKNNIDRLARIINELLDISKIESGTAGLTIGAFEVISAVKETISDFEARIKNSGLELSIDLPKENVIINGDKDGVMQVLTNLFSNSLKFTKQGRIEVSVKDLEGMVEFSVSDTGIGISKENIPKLFEKFQQFSRTSGPGDKGTGLGLAIARGIVRLHKGNIWAESEPGKGTRITFTLPKNI